MQCVLLELVYQFLIEWSLVQHCAEQELTVGSFLSSVVYYLEICLLSLLISNV